MSFEYFEYIVIGCQLFNYSISDEWISANKPSFTKTMQLTSLTQSERVSLLDHLNYSYKFPTNCSLLSSTVSTMSENSTKIADKT